MAHFMAMNSIRAFLQKNKIFFEIFSFIIIGITGILFSYFQWKSNEHQIEMHKTEIQPLFRITFPLFKITSEDVYDTEVLEIYNDGQAFKTFQYNIKTFYVLDYSSFKKNINSSYYVPVIGFYFSQMLTGSFTGKLVEGYLQNNNTEFMRVYKECMKATQEDNFYFLGKINLIRIDYQDIDNEKHTLYYKDRNQIPEKSYNEIFEQSGKIFGGLLIEPEKITLDSIKSFIK